MYYLFKFLPDEKYGLYNPMAPFQMSHLLRIESAIKQADIILALHFLNECLNFWFQENNKPS